MQNKQEDKPNKEERPSICSAVSCVCVCVLLKERKGVADFDFCFASSKTKRGKKRGGKLADFY